MANQRYSEDGDGNDLPEKVKGKSGGPAKFSGQASKDGDDQEANLNKTGVNMPHESPKHLPKAGGQVK